MHCLLCFSAKGKFEEFLADKDNDTFKNIAFVFPELIIGEPGKPLYICVTCLKEVTSFYTIKITTLENFCRLNQFKSVLQGTSNCVINELRIIINHDKSSSQFKNNIDYNFRPYHRDLLSLVDQGNPTYIKEEVKEFEDLLDDGSNRNSNNSSQNLTNLHVDKITENDIAECTTGQDDCNRDSQSLSTEEGFTCSDIEECNKNEESNKCPPATTTSTYVTPEGEHPESRSVKEVTTFLEPESTSQALEGISQVTSFTPEVEPYNSQVPYYNSYGLSNNPQCPPSQPQPSENYSNYYQPEHQPQSVPDILPPSLVLCNPGLTFVVSLQTCVDSNSTSNGSNSNDEPKPQHENQKRQFKCVDCQKSFTDKQLLYKHCSRSHLEKRFKCTTCEKAFTSNSYLEVHELSHTGVKPYKCDVCDKALSTATKLKYHKRSHTGERPYTCTTCQKSFSLCSSLARHKLIHTGVKQHKCDVCHKTFITSTKLKDHSRIHTGEKPYKCLTCQRTFAYSNNLNIHKHTHTGEKPYKCNICQKAFPSPGNLIRHKITHNTIKQKPHKCDICKKTFTTAGNLTRHKNTHNTIEKNKCDTKCTTEKNNKKKKCDTKVSQKK